MSMLEDEYRRRYGWKDEMAGFRLPPTCGYVVTKQAVDPLANGHRKPPQDDAAVLRRELASARAEIERLKHQNETQAGLIRALAAKYNG